MTMSLSVTIPLTPSSGTSPSTDAPRTPISPNMPTPGLPESATSVSSGNGNPTAAPSQPKRKPSRRANTAERRATHNAVERQRRETLNGRFLDLAALLPNLSQIRRPSKSSIVNSSIAHVHASRRHRLLASRELRLLKSESDALRRELNEWRDRSGLPRVEEPVRSDGFAMILSGELEVITSVPGEEEEDEDNMAYGGGYEDEYSGSMDGIDELNGQIPLTVPVQNGSPFAHNLPPANGSIQFSHVPPRSSHGPVIASSPSAVSFENSAMTALFESQPHQNHQFTGAQFVHQQSPQDEKWNPHVFSSLNNSQQMQMLQAQRALYTPPSSAHGLPTAPPSSHGSPPATGYSDHAPQTYFANFQRQQFNPMHQQISPQTSLFDHDDASSVGSGQVGRARSSSVSGNGSAYGSPPHVPNVGSFEMQSPLAGEFGLMRTGSGPGHWTPTEVELSGMGMMKQNVNGSAFGIMV